MSKMKAILFAIPIIIPITTSSVASTKVFATKTWFGIKEDGTNESSCKIGYDFGVNNYKCINQDEPCDGPYAGQMSDECSLGTHGTVTNATTCQDGYLDGFIGVFHKRWGYIPKKDNPEQLSVTAIEYERAKNMT